MTLRDFLERRERELIAEITEHHAKLVPLEAELAEVRSAKGALGISEAVRAETELTALAVRASDAIHDGRPINQLGGTARAIGTAATITGHLSTLVRSRAPLTAISPWSNLTMKQLVVKALREHFPNGATTQQLLDFFRDAWGRNIARANLSPQISRLHQDGVLGRLGHDPTITTSGRSVWFLQGHPEADRLAAQDSPDLVDPNE